MVEQTDSEKIEDGLERALRELEGVSELLAPEDKRSDPLSWIIDRLTEMSVIGEELHPDWWYAIQPAMDELQEAANLAQARDV